MEIPNYELNEWLKELKPYQSEIVQELVDKYGVEEAIDKWILAKGPSNTVKFGGSGEESREKFSKRYKNEINKFICGHPDYSDYRDEFGKINENAKTAIVSTISAVIGSHLGVSGAILSPVIVLSLYLAGKMGVKAYCSGIIFE
ncbi:MAG: hypothetical protein E7H79_01360 [Clostridium perfringens]|nr:hypothetical protein [Clostridium perfringens]